MFAAIALRESGRADQMKVRTSHEDTTVGDLDLGLDGSQAAAHVEQAHDRLPPGLAAWVCQRHGLPQPLSTALASGESQRPVHVRPQRDCAIHHRDQVDQAEVAGKLHQCLLGGGDRKTGDALALEAVVAKTT